MIDYTDILDRLSNKLLPSEYEVSRICAKAKEILSEESNIVLAAEPIFIVGNIHGQLDDLLNILELGGGCPHSNFLFMGGYVNRGDNSIGVFLYLLCLKILYCDRVILLRGNHESKEITMAYGFYDECIKKYGTLNVWRDCTDVFYYLPIAAILENSAFVVHGGLSPSIGNISELQMIDRKDEFEPDKTIIDLLWSDPSTDSIDAGWRLNPRGFGYTFDRTITEDFLHINNLKKIYRGHQVVQEGFKQIFDNKISTIWSAPNFLRKLGNSGAILSISEGKKEQFTVFQAAKIKPSDKFEPQFSSLFVK